MMHEGTLAGFGILALEIIVLISSGEKEPIDIIEDHLGKGDIIEYLQNKYCHKFFIPFDNSMYDNKMLNRYFSNYDGFIQGNERRKYGIQQQDDGLLMILALMTDKIEIESRKWDPID